MSIVPAGSTRAQLLRAVQNSVRYYGTRAANQAIDYYTPRAIQGGINLATKSVKGAYGYAVSKYHGNKGRPKSFRGRRKTRRVGMRSTRKKPLRKVVKDLKKQVDAQNGTLIYRARVVNVCLAPVNQAAYVNVRTVNMSDYETVLAELRFFNPSSPSTLTQASGVSGTYSRDWLFSSVYSNAYAKNNYQVPCKVTLYLCTPKQDTSILPLTAFSNGLADVGNPSDVSPLTYLTDSDEFNDLWKIKKSGSKMLMPGQQLHLTHSFKNMMYSPATFDSHALSYQRKFGTFVIIARVEGMLAHDSSASERGFAQAGIDVSCDTTYKVTYEAGVDLKYIVVANSSSTFTNGAVMSLQPTSDNQSYSVA